MNSENIVPDINRLSELDCSSLPIANNVLKPASKSLYLTPGKKTVTPAKSLTASKKLHTPRSNHDSLSNTGHSQFTASTAATSVTRPKTCSKIPNKKALLTPNSTASNELFTSCLQTDVSLISSSASTIDTSQSNADAREAAKLAKLQNTQQRIFKVSLLKEKWAKEKEMKLAQYKVRREQELRKVQEDNAYHAELRRKQLEKQRALEEQKKEQEKVNLAIKHESNLQLKKDLERERQAKRRISIFLNQTILKKQKEKQKELEEQAKQAQIEDLTLKRLDALTVREQKTLEAIRRRESLHHRLEEAKLSKEKEKLIFDQLYHQRDRELLEIRYENWQDEKLQRELQQLAAKEELQRQQALSVQIKQQEKKAQAMKELETISLWKTKEINWQDEQLYKQSLQEAEKKELEWQGNHWKLTKQQQEDLKQQQALQEQLSRELDRQAYQDMKDYEAQCREQRRQSLAYRLQKAKKDHDYDLGQKALQQLVDEEEKKLKDADRQAVKEYRQHLQDLRRQSLEYRSQLFYQEKMRQQGEQQTKQQQEQADYELRRQAWKDVQDHQRLEQQRRRDSIAWRLADKHRQQEIALTAHQQKLEALHLDLQCRREDWLALQEYKGQEAEKRRKSIQFRLDSWKKQKLAEEQAKLRELMQEQEEILLKEMDREELLAAKLTQEMMERHNLLSASEMQM